MKKLLILDSNSIINRAFYGVRYLAASDGTQTNAIYGFLNIFIKLVNEYKPDCVCAAFDLKAPTFRHKMYAEYKAQRKPMPDGLAVQMPIARDVVRAMNIPLFEIEGYEADDIIGTVSRICEENDVECLIATGDKDDLQLASDKTKILLTVTSKGQSETTVYDSDAVFERYGVTPSEFIDVKALMGDSSDNIPGVPGIGEKTAIKVISNAHSIEAFYANPSLGGVKGATLQKLTDGKESAYLSKTLASIDRYVPMDFDIEKCTFSSIEKQASGELYSILKKLELNSVIKRLKLEPSTSSVGKINILENIEIINSIPSLSGTAGFFLSHTDKHIHALALAQNDHAYIMTESDCSQKELFDKLKEIAANDNLKKIVFNIKNTLVEFHDDVKFEAISDDLAIAEYLVNPSKGSYTIEQLAEEYLNAAITKNEQTQLSLIDYDDNSDINYYAQCVTALLKLQQPILKKISVNQQDELYRNVELPLVQVLANMQIRGFLVDTDELEKFSVKVNQHLEELTTQIYELAGEEFNLNSPKQLGEILFEKLGLPAKKKTKKGYSTNAEVLEEISELHPIVDLVIDFRQYSKLKSTYCDGLRTVISATDRRIHSIFTQTVTVTGRLSSTEPNLQNIPTRTELGREMRKMFIAKEGYTLVDADYSQIELRILANIANDETMLKAFENNEDVHAYTASQILDIPINEVTKEQRYAAKAVNFGIVYGIREFSLAKDIHTSVKEAKAYINSYLEKYHGVRDYMAQIKEQAKQNGYVKTLMNRIRYIPELKSSNFNIRQFGERVALNTPIQGSAADLIKLAMVRVEKKLNENNMKSRLILQVHDELIIEAENSEIETVKKILKETMENVIDFKVKLAIDMSEGKSWYDAK